MIPIYSAEVSPASVRGSIVIGSWQVGCLLPNIRLEAYRKLDLRGSRHFSVCLPKPEHYNYTFLAHDVEMQRMEREFGYVSDR